MRPLVHKSDMIRNYSRITDADGERFIRVRTSEQLLISATRELVAARLLCTSLGRAQFAADYVRRDPNAQVWCHFLDTHLAMLAREANSDLNAKLTICCQADFIAEDFDAVCLPCTSQGDAELTRDLLQTGHQRLVTSGHLFATTDNPADVWLHQEMKKLFDKVTRTPFANGVAYSATKMKPLQRLRNFYGEFAFRDKQQLIRALSRPGVFSHRRLDVGSRALIEAMEIRAGDRVLDLGCGSGVVSFAAALRSPDVRVLAIDSNPRAIECTERGAALNGITTIDTRLAADAACGSPGQFDLVLANPPYFSQFRISEIFLRGAARALREGGIVQIVTKRPDDYPARMAANFDAISVVAVRQYWIVRGVRGSTPLS